MKQLLILSGKGGTGKTTIAGAFIKLSDCRAFADCDVDAPNLHLIMRQEVQPKEQDFYGLGKAVINSEKCTNCGLCRKVCRFGAISENKIDVFACEGCAVCLEFCPSGAIAMEVYLSGKRMLYKDDAKLFSTAILKMGSGNSGKLVSSVKKQLLDAISDEKLLVIDGSPGIGCSVIASISGVDLVLIVAEPSVSGISDMKRIIKTARLFHAVTVVCINKWDINPVLSKTIEAFCEDNKIEFSGKIPFDATVIKALNDGKSIAEYGKSDALDAIKEVFNKTMKILYN